MIKNPNYQEHQVTLNRPGDLGILQDIINSWPPDSPEITTHELADEFAKRLTTVEIEQIQAAYPRGLGEYIEKLIKDMEQ